MEILTIGKLVKTNFKDLYIRFLSDDALSDSEYTKILSVAIILLNSSRIELNRLGYRIILLYCIRKEKYEGLYDVSINSGLIPIAALISHYDIESSSNDTFIRNYMNSYMETFKKNNIIMTEQQVLLNQYMKEKYNESLVIIAPTSYGKSELIISTIQDNPNLNICILVPSKALLAQTKKRILNSNILDLRKIITHPDGYRKNDKNKIFIFTQERLNKLLSEDKELSFDIVFVDEAHNLLQGDYRNELLASVICILGARNKKTSFKYLTPFICDELNLKIRFLDTPFDKFRISEYVKTERFYFYDFRRGKLTNNLMQYDNYLNIWIGSSKKYKDHIELIKSESLSKNIIYANKPKNIEKFSRELCCYLPEIDCPLIKIACKELSKNINSQYFIIECLKKGIVYHHGSMPDNIKLYIENLFIKSKSIKYLICSSTLLEGVNLPIDRIFIIDHRNGRSNLTSSQFKNLIGRVNRFSEIFSYNEEKTIKKLESRIYLLGVDSYTSKKANLEEFYPKVVKVGRKEKDKVNNVLLHNKECNEIRDKRKYKNAIERLGNLQPSLLKNIQYKKLLTDVGSLMLSNSINEIDVFKFEKSIKLDLLKYSLNEGLIDNIESLIGVIGDKFIVHINEEDGYKDILRLKENATRKFYMMLLNWRIKNYSMNQIINRYITYWNDEKNNDQDDLVYVGKWGDTKARGGVREFWVHMSTKSEKEKINLAIVRHKEEEDFIDYNIMKFVEVLNSLEMIETSFYRLIKYGTTDELQIKIINEGFSRKLAELIFNKYNKYIKLLSNDDIIIRNSLIEAMKNNNENEFLIFEAKMNLGN